MHTKQRALNDGKASSYDGAHGGIYSYERLMIEQLWVLDAYMILQFRSLVFVKLLLVVAYETASAIDSMTSSFQIRAHE